MTFADQIMQAQHINDVFDLVNEFVDALQNTGALDNVPSTVRPSQINDGEALSYWLNLVTEEIQGQIVIRAETPESLFALHAVLETAVQKLRSGMFYN